MALNFPTAPVVGQIFSSEGEEFIWSGSLWVVLSAANFPWATAAEAIAGARNNLAISPLTADAAIDARGYVPGPLSGIPVDMTASRLTGTDYLNDSGIDLLTAIVWQHPSTAASAGIRLSPNPIGFGAPTTLFSTEDDSGAGSRRRGSAIIVPAGWYYRFGTTSGVVILNWFEYRGAPA